MFVCNLLHHVGVVAKRLRAAAELAAHEKDNTPTPLAHHHVVSNVMLKLKNK